MTAEITAQTYNILEKLATLEEALLAKTPNMPILLKEIHTILRKDPDLVTILTEENCNTIVTGLKRLTATEIAVSAMKAPRKKALKSIGVADL